MITYIIKRILQIIPILIAISIISFIVIELPPGDFLTSKIAQLTKEGGTVSETELNNLRVSYGLDKPVVQRYFIWIWKIISRGDFGRSFKWNKPVFEVIGERLMLTVIISITTLIFVWVVAIPIGVLSATRQYSIFDYGATFIGFIGLAVPNFLLALILMFISYKYFGVTITGLFSQEYADSAWNFGKFLDMMKHIWVPVVVIGTSGTAGIIRTLRGCLLDELKKQYVVTARAKGLSERKILFKYPVRIALNPLISTIGWVLPGIISGDAIVANVLNLPTTGTVLLESLQFQDMYLAASFVLLLSFLTVIGTLISDILLALTDPRIRYERNEKNV
ncbi:ABC transporter permease [Tepiditoga spiralis]|uniref:ABC transporter permease n=1 Tax=Tepiditoga spiralis TaxID=2108365 RepID=A0A7G1G4P6_9BACT|nr:ABC transporter permease [Tepiditoga spiralis]BBE31500.1 ABC transporter permease [Tepiditoga spiralis]